MAVTLQDLVLAVAGNLHDLVEGATSAAQATANKMTDAARIRGDGTNRHLNSQVLFLQPAATTAGLTGANPKTVTAFDGATGIFTFADNWAGANGVPSGVAYAIINVAGEGYAYNDIVRAARAALKALRPEVAVTATAVAVTLAAGLAANHSATVPSTLSCLSEVRVVRGGYDIGRIQPGRDGWRVVPGTYTLHVPGGIDLEGGDTLTLYGVGPATVPTALTGSVEVDEEEWLNATVEFLTRADDQRALQQLAANLYMDRTRTVPQYRRPNTYKVG